MSDLCRCADEVRCERKLEIEHLEAELDSMHKDYQGLTDLRKWDKDRIAKLEAVVDALKAERSLLGHGKENFLSYFRATNTALAALENKDE